MCAYREVQSTLHQPEARCTGDVCSRARDGTVVPAAEARYRVRGGTGGGPTPTVPWAAIGPPVGHGRRRIDPLRPECVRVTSPGDPTQPAGRSGGGICTLLSISTAGDSRLPQREFTASRKWACLRFGYGRDLPP